MNTGYSFVILFHLTLMTLMTLMTPLPRPYKPYCTMGG